MLIRKLLATTTLAVGLTGAGLAGVSTVIGSTATAGAPFPCTGLTVCRSVPVDSILNPIPQPDLVVIDSVILRVVGDFVPALTLAP